MKSHHRMGAEVGEFALKLREIVPCALCALGIAMAVVERRWRIIDEIDWSSKPQTHPCKMGPAGITPRHIAAVEALASTLDVGEEPEVVAPALGEQVDTRLPPERDDEAGVA